MKLIIGLGNPGQKYLMTRHNIGFLCLDAIARFFNAPDFKTNLKSHISSLSVSGEKIILCKPQTFMNLSGEAVRAVMDFYQVAVDDILVIHDDIDQSFGAIKFQKSRGHGGHNGIRDIHKHLSSNEYARLKIGVGRPSHPGHDVADYVLQNFSKSEENELPSLIETVCEATEEFIFNGFTASSNKFNKKGT